MDDGKYFHITVNYKPKSIGFTCSDVTRFFCRSTLKLIGSAYCLQNSKEPIANINSEKKTYKVVVFMNEDIIITHAKKEQSPLAHEIRF